MRKLLNFIKERYGNPELIITENGTSDNDGDLDDEHRVEFYKGYINNVLKGELSVYITKINSVIGKVKNRPQDMFTERLVVSFIIL